MKRLHMHIGVEQLEEAIQFYSKLLEAEPVKRKPDYAKWMLDDPAINFSITCTACGRGIDHVGVQFDTLDELNDLRDRLHSTSTESITQDAAECCYAKSDKNWLRDPDGVVWETFVTHEQRETFGADRAPIDFDHTKSAERCCA